MNNNLKHLQNFFDAENKRDFFTLEGYLHPQVMWFMHTEDSHMPIAGREEYMDRIRAAYQETSATFTCEGVDVSSSGNRIIATLRHSDNTRSIVIFDFEDTLIKWRHEYVMT